MCDEVDMYSDEYDDTYDSDGVTPTADVTEDVRRPFVTPRALLTHDKRDNEVRDHRPINYKTDIRHKKIRSIVF